MGGGGGNQQQQASNTPAPASHASGGVSPYITSQGTTFPAHMPGGLEAIASQLQAGFGGQNQLPFLQNLHQPMTLPKPSPFSAKPAASAPAAAPTAAPAAATAPSGNGRQLMPHPGYWMTVDGHDVYVYT